MTPCGSVVTIICFHLAYFVCMNSKGKSLEEKKKIEFLSIPVNVKEVLLLNQK